MADVVTSLLAGVAGGVYGGLWLGRPGLVGGAAIGASLGFLMEEEAPEAQAEAEERSRRPVRALLSGRGRGR